MNKYDYSNLNSNEFEEFVCELMNEHYNMELCCFKAGKDKGIDLLYANKKNLHHTVVQVKHYTTNIKVLLGSLKVEFRKVVDLKPDFYWIVTSLPLSLADKKAIKEVFGDYIPTTSYILGNNDLNRLLSKNPKIEKQWVKLWFTSAKILEQIINNAIHGRSKFHRNKIHASIKLFVKTKAYDEAYQMLKTNKLLLITGQPGVGKTTLADLLTFNFLAQKFELIYVDRDLSAAELALENAYYDPQIFYFDDFLGANYNEIMYPTNTDSAIVNFIENIQATKNKYLILTSRTTIFKNARQSYDRLNRSSIEIHQKELYLGNYSIEEKGMILYNHLYHSDILPEMKQAVIRDDNYWKIIRHKNYTPRLISFFSMPDKVKHLSADSYMNYILRNLENPEEVWRYSYTNQIQDVDRFMIGTLFSFGRQFVYISVRFDRAIDLECLKIAFERRITTEIKNNGYIRSNDSFNMSLQRLLDGYLISFIEGDSKRQYIDFINPSVIDFLGYYYKSSEEEQWKIIHGAVYIGQLMKCYEEFFSKLVYEDYRVKVRKFIKHLEANEFQYLPTLHLDDTSPIDYLTAYHCEMAGMLRNFRYMDEINDILDPLILDHFSKIPFESINSSCFDLIFGLISEPFCEYQLEEYVSEHWNRIIMGMLPFITNEEEFDKLYGLCKTYEKNFKTLFVDSEHGNTLYKNFESFVSDEITYIIHDRTDKFKSVEDLDMMKIEVRKKRAELFDKYGLWDNGFDEYFYFNDLDVEEIIRGNKKLKQIVLNPVERQQLVMDEESMVLNINRLFLSGNNLSGEIRST